MGAFCELLDGIYRVMTTFFIVLLIQVITFICSAPSTTSTDAEFLKVVDEQAPPHHYYNSNYKAANPPPEILLQHSKKSSCRVCLELYAEGDVIRKLKCNHTFHKDCVDKWLLQQCLLATCPLCRLAVLPEEDVVVKARRTRHTLLSSDDETVLYWS